MGGKILLFFSLKNKRLEGQRESLFPKMPNLSLLNWIVKKDNHKSHEFPLIPLKYK